LALVAAYLKIFRRFQAVSPLLTVALKSPPKPLARAP
jgi:hypothetical protein